MIGMDGAAPTSAPVAAGNANATERTMTLLFVLGLIAAGAIAGGCFTYAAIA